MKILYGVQGTGNGHITRARIMAKALAARGIEVDWLFSGRKADAFFDMEAFGDYRLVRGLTFHTTHGRIDYWRTLIENNLPQLFRDIRSLDTNAYDLVISDFEPVSAWAAKQQQKIVIGLSHQSAFLQAIPKAPSTMATRALMKYFAPSSIPVGLHWNHFNMPILPPLVEVSTHPITTDERVYLVYLPFAAIDDIVELLAEVTNARFNIFHPVIWPHELPAHITQQPLSRDGFLQHLHACEGVICSAGFELPSEALHLGKKLLVQPVTGQYEQISNALALEKLGYAEVVRILDSTLVSRWIEQPGRDPVEFPDVAEALAEWIGADCREPLEDMSKRLWNTNDT